MQLITGHQQVVSTGDFTFSHYQVIKIESFQKFLNFYVSSIPHFFFSIPFLVVFILFNNNSNFNSLLLILLPHKMIG